jgi:hypothetical protein
LNVIDTILPAARVAYCRDDAWYCMAHFHSFIDVSLWNQAKWGGTAYLVDPSGSQPPCIGLIYGNSKAGKDIFKGLRERIGEQDTFEELRIAIIEGPIPGRDDGYSVHVSSNIDGIRERAKSQGISLEPDKIIRISRVHRMTPSPASPHLSNFKTAYQAHGKYLLIPLSGVVGGPVEPHLDLAIQKTKIHFRRVEDVQNNDYEDGAIFT